MRRIVRAIFRAVAWTIYIFGIGRRRAWCELTGGHKTELLGCWMGGDRATSVQVYCPRCDRQSGWIDVPRRSSTVIGENGQ